MHAFIPDEEGRVEYGLMMVSDTGMWRAQNEQILTAMAVPGRKIIVNEAIVFMAELSRREALAISLVTLVSLTAM